MIDHARETPHISPDVRSAGAGDSLVLLDLRSGKYLALSATAALIWRQLEAGRAPAQIAELVRDRYGIPAPRATADVEAMVEHLHHVRAAQPCCQAHLALEASDGLRARRDVTVHELERHGGFPPEVLRAPHRAHSAAPNLGNQPVFSAENDAGHDDVVRVWTLVVSPWEAAPRICRSRHAVRRLGHPRAPYH